MREFNINIKWCEANDEDDKACWIAESDDKNYPFITCGDSIDYLLKESRLIIEDLLEIDDKDNTNFIMKIIIEPITRLLKRYN